MHHVKCGRSVRSETGLFYLILSSYCKIYVNIFCLSEAEDGNGNSDGKLIIFRLVVQVIILAFPKHLTVYVLQVIKEGRGEEDEVVVVSVTVG